MTMTEQERDLVRDAQSRANIFPWPQPLAADAYHGLAGDVVHAIEPHTEADPAALLVTFLCYFGGCLGRGPHATAEADRHACNLNAILVGPTAKARKGVSHGHIRELFSRVDPEWATVEHIAMGLSSGEGLIWAVRDPVRKISKKGEEGTVDEGVEDKRLLVIESEFAAVLKVMARETNTLSAVIRQAWDGGTLRVMTRNSPVRATDAHISILGHITQHDLLRYLHDGELFNGFANRFLWVSTRRSKVLPEGGGQPDYHLIVPALRDALERGRTLGRIERDDGARALWARVYERLSEGLPGMLGAVVSRSEAQVLRLSLLYAVLDGSPTITREHLLAALAVWDYCEASARYVYGQSTGDSLADRIYQAASNGGGKMDRTAIRDLFDRNSSADRIATALRLLQALGLMSPETVQTSGRPAEQWTCMRYDINDQRGV